MKNKKLIVAGCLVERYRGDIRKEMPEVDAIVGTNELDRIVALKFLTDRPKDAHWLAPEERTALERRLEAEAEDTRASGYAGIGQALTNPRVIELGLL